VYPPKRTQQRHLVKPEDGDSTNTDVAYSCNAAATFAHLKARRRQSTHEKKMHFRDAKMYSAFFNMQPMPYAKAILDSPHFSIGFSLLLSRDARKPN
jgi:hypothetical protein